MEKHDEFFKSLRTYLFVSITPIVIIGIIVLFILSGYVTKRSQNLNQKIITQYSNYIDTEISLALKMSEHIQKNGIVNEFVMSKFDNKNDLNICIHKTINELSNYTNIDEVITDVAVYSSNNDIFVNAHSYYNREEYFDKHIQSNGVTYEEFENSLTYESRAYYYLGIDSNAKKNANIIFCRNIIFDDKTIGVVMFLLNRDALVSEIKNEQNISSIEFAAINKKHDIIFQTDNCSQDVISFAINTGKNGFFAYKNNYVFTLQARKIVDSYVFYIDKSEYSGNVDILIIVFCVLLLLVVLCSSYFAHRKNLELKGFFVRYNERNILISNKLSEYMSLVQKNDMIKMLQNQFDVYGNRVTYKFNFKHKYMRVAVLNILRESSYSNSEQEVIARAVKRVNNEIYSELLNKNILAEFAQIDEFLYVFVLNYQRNGDSRIIESVFKNGIENCGIIAQIGIGREIDDVERLSQSYDEAFITINQLENFKNSTVVFYENIEYKGDFKFELSSEKKANLSRAIRLGHIDIVSELLDDIYAENYDYKTNVICQRLIFELITILYNVVWEMYETNAEKMHMFQRIFRNVTHMNEAAAFEVLREVFLGITKDTKKSSKQDDMKNNILRLIDEMCYSSDFSLQMLADNLNISYYYLSRQFTDIFGTGFTSFITCKRLDAAKKLLETSDLSVDAVALKVGFLSSSSFISVFKKHYGVTPTQYRKITIKGV